MTSLVSNGTYTISDVTGNHTIGATFAAYPIKKVLNGSRTYYLNLQSAFNASSGGEEFDIVQNYNFIENTVFSSDISVTLKGGYLSDFSSRAGMTTINGSLTISHGTIVVDSIVIK